MPIVLLQRAISNQFSLTNLASFRCKSGEMGECLLQDPSKFRKIARAIALYSSISSYFVGSILIGIFSGRWLDNYFETNSLFLIIGFLFGLGAAIMGIYYAIKQFLGDDSS